jgi:hypothetical protein
MALVTGKGDSQKAVISAVVVRQIDRAEKKRLRFRGTVKFSDSVRRHIGDTLLPVVYRIVEQLGLPEKCFEISGMNLGAASALDVGVSISGLSADLPIFIAMLSAALQVSTSEDFVATGHIASLHGDITAVKGIPPKLEAAINDGSIKRFIYPDLRGDTSLKVLSPNQRDRSITAIMAARDIIQAKAVRGIDELVREVFAEEDVLLASLKQDFFDVSAPRDGGTDPVSGAIGYLAGDNEKRFWDVLQRHFWAGNCEKAKESLEAYAAFFIRQRRYPTGFGARLFQLVCSLPPQVRRLKMKFPILGEGLCFELSRLAQPSDYGDVPLLLDAALGRHIAHKSEPCALSEQPAMVASDADCMVFDTVMSMINEQTLAREVDIPIDSARGSYTLPSSTVDTYEEFLGTLHTFYVHVQRHIIPGLTEAQDATESRQGVIALLERAFRARGGDKAALAIARDGTRGGMRSILDALAEQLKAERQAAYIQRVFKNAVAALDWDENVRFMRGAMRRLGPFLPAELRTEPAERFARNWEAIIQAYVQSLDRVGQLLRTM